MKLIVTDHGDPSVGIFPETWEVDSPHDGTEPDGRELFRDLILQAYGEFCEGKLTAYYDFELQAEADAEKEFDEALRKFDEEKIIPDYFENEPCNYGNVDFNNL